MANGQKEVSIQQWEKDRARLGTILAAATLHWHLDQDFEQGVQMIEDNGGAGDFWHSMADVAMEAVNASLADLIAKEEKESEEQVKN